ncbi:MAG: TrgA family protein [Pseudorhodobacter sp.]
MPRFSKLIAAIAFAMVAYFSAQAYMSTLPPGTQFGPFLPVSAGVGLICGWVIMGNALGGGYGVAAGGGIKTAICMVVWVLLIFSIVLMVRKAFRKLYQGPMQALVDIFALMLEHLLLMPYPPFLIALALGGILGGWISEWSRRRWD